MTAGDRDALGILMRNLVDNAIKYTPRGGRVDVRIDRIDGSTRLTVEDSGPGVTAPELPRLFDRFHRGDAIGGPDDEDGDERPPGSGLGLAIVHAIATRHGATVQADRSPTLGGLRVRIDFPDASLTASAIAKATASKNA